MAGHGRIRLPENNLVIIQARMGSKRLPGKSMSLIGDKPLIDHVVRRALEIRQIQKLILATTILEEDDEIATYVREEFGIGVYRGDPEDVRSRFVEIIKSLSPKNIIRITADDPFKDPKLADDALESLIANSFDYVSNFAPQCLPIGLDVEAFTANAFMDSYSKFQGQDDIEHVTVALRNSGIYHTNSLRYKSNLSNFRLTIDGPEDLVKCRIIYSMLGEVGATHLFDYQVTCRVIENAIEMGKV